MVRVYMRVSHSCADISHVHSVTSGVHPGRFITNCIVVHLGVTHICNHSVQKTNSLLERKWHLHGKNLRHIRWHTQASMSHPSWDIHVFLFDRERDNIRGNSNLYLIIYSSANRCIMTQSPFLCCFRMFLYFDPRWWLMIHTEFKMMMWRCWLPGVPRRKKKKTQTKNRLWWKRVNFWRSWSAHSNNLPHILVVNSYFESVDVDNWLGPTGFDFLLKIFKVGTFSSRHQCQCHQFESMRTVLKNTAAPFSRVQLFLLSFNLTIYSINRYIILCKNRLKNTDV